MSQLLLDLLKNSLAPGKWKMVSRSSKKGEEWAGPCPVCSGTDRFRCWPSEPGGEVAREAGALGTWWCRQCDKGGDAIALLMWAKGMDFVAACRELRIELSGGPGRSRPLRQPKPEPAWEPTVWDIPSEKWRGQTTKLAQEANEYLLGYADGLKYLANRGLPPEAVKLYGLGYLAGDDKTGTCRYRHRSAFGLPEETSGQKVKKVLWIPRGITIPLWGPAPEGGEAVHRLRIRRRAQDLKEGESKFLLLKGSGQAPMIIAPTSTSADRAVWMVVEAELDAMAVHHACGGKVGVIAVLTNRGKPDAAAHKLLKSAPAILVALDFDEPNNQGQRPGGQGWPWWKKEYSRAKRWPVPLGKDPGEAVALGVDLAQWVADALPRRPEVLPGGSAGAVVSEMIAEGEGDMPPLPEQTAPAESNRWPGAGSDTPLSEAALPDGLGVQLGFLRDYYAGRELTPDVLVPCPRTRPHPWLWWAMKKCQNCRGHRNCLIDFITSPQMLAPLETVNG